MASPPHHPIPSSLSTAALGLRLFIRAAFPFTRAMDRLLVSDCLSILLAYLFISMNKPLVFVCSEPCTRNTWCQDKFFPLIASIWGQGGPGQLGHIGSPPNMPNSSKVYPVRGLDFEQDLHTFSLRWGQGRPPHWQLLQQVEAEKTSTSTLVEAWRTRSSTSRRS